MLTFDELKSTALRHTDMEPEIWLNFTDKNSDYMIIVFKDKCSFQRCGSQGVSPFDGSGEMFYKSLDELYETETIDGILLKRDWDKITSIYSFEPEDLTKEKL